MHRNSRTTRNDPQRHSQGDLHPSGLTWDRWNSPWKHEDERKLVVRFNRKNDKQIALESIMDLGEALL